LIEQVNAKYDNTLLLLHGFPTSSYDYIKLWPMLKELKINSLVTFDFVGHGFSDKPADYDYNLFDMADMVDALLMHLNIKENVYVVSHDFSDSVLQELLRRDNLKNQNHFQIAKCVLLNGGIMTDIYRPTLSQELLRTRVINKFAAKYFFQYALFKHSFRAVFGSLNPPNSSELYDFYLTVRYNAGNEILPLTIQYMNEREQYGDVWYDALNETSIPAMFIYGPADPINPADKFPQKFRLDLPAVRLVVLSEFVGHYPHFEDTFTVFELIKNFFQL
jgi:pimeloyl-ACP methyl ester carboxylesterase